LVGTHLGVTPDRNHLLIGLHATARVVRSRRLTLNYAPEIAPLLLISNNPKYRRFQEGDVAISLSKMGKDLSPVLRFLRSGSKLRFS